MLQANLTGTSILWLLKHAGTPELGRLNCERRRPFVQFALALYHWASSANLQPHGVVWGTGLVLMQEQGWVEQQEIGYSPPAKGPFAERDRNSIYSYRSLPSLTSFLSHLAPQTAQSNTKIFSSAFL